MIIKQPDSKNNKKKMETKNCPQCGEEFTGRANKLYCSSKCKMDAFNSTNLQVKNGLVTEQLGINGLSSSDEKPFTNSQETDKQNMVLVSVPFTIAEKELLDTQAKECKTVLPKLIRIRSLMDETDIREMQQTIEEQRQEIEELRIRNGFYQEQRNGLETDNRFRNGLETVKRFSEERSRNGLYVEMTPNQLEFLKQKFLESLDYESDSTERLPDGSTTSNERKSLEFHERKKPGQLKQYMEITMFHGFLNCMEEKLIEYCGYNEDELMDNPLIDEFDKIGKRFRNG